METIPEFTSLTENMFKRFLEENGNVFEENLEYDKAYLEELINQEDPMLLDAKSNNSILTQEILNIQENEQRSNIFRSESFYSSASKYSK